jgi:hypothetical protein
MPLKDLIALALILFAVAGGTLAATASKRMRDLLFILMVFLAPQTELFDVNFVSRDFYRGTVRGFEVSLVDALSLSVLVSALLTPRKGQRRIYLMPALPLMALFFLYCLFNVAISEPRLFGMFELSKMFRGMVIFMAVALYVQSERELRIALFALGVAICYQGYLGFKQRYLWGVHRVFGTLDSPNSLSALVCLTAPVLVAGFNSHIPKWLKGVCAAALALSLVLVVMTISRAGVVIMGVVMAGTALTTMSWRFGPKKLAIMSLALLAAVGIVAKGWNTLMSRFKESTLKEEYENKDNQGRGYYIRMAKAISSDAFWGVGLNNWSYWVSNKYGPRLGYHFNPYKGTDREPNYQIKKGVTNIDDPQAAPAHNLAALTVGELGIVGLLIFTVLWLRWFQMGFTFLFRHGQAPMKLVGTGVFFGLWGIFLQSLTEWVFRHSPVAYMVHILLGLLAGLYYAHCREGRLTQSTIDQPSPEFPSTLNAQPSTLA